MDITAQVIEIVPPKDLTPTVNKFKQYLMDNVELIDDVRVLEMSAQVRARQAEAGITGHTHLFICVFALGEHLLSLNASKKSTRGWKKNVEFVNKSYEKFIRCMIKEQSIKL